MIECPRCGFEQPKDQFCAKCGLDIENYVAKPKPALVRLLQNPNLHLTLIGCSIVVLVGYIIYSQRDMVSRQMGDLLDLPVSSRDAGDPNEVSSSRRNMRAAHNPAPQPVTQSADTAEATTGELAAVAAEPPESEKSDSAAPKLTANSKIEVIHWEVPREALANLLTLAEKLGESNAGRAYLYPIGGKIAEQVQNIGQRLSSPRTVATRPNSQITMSTPPSATEAFQFGLFLQVTKIDEKDLGLKWEAQLVLPQQESAAEAASTTPAVRSAVETALNGSASMNGNGLILIVMEPINRSPREEFLARAGEGPWSIFTSPEFRSGMTEWVITVQIK